MVSRRDRYLPHGDEAETIAGGLVALRRNLLAKRRNHMDADRECVRPSA